MTGTTDVLHATGCVDVNPRRGLWERHCYRVRVADEKVKFKAPEGFPLRSSKLLSFYKTALG